MGTLNRTVNVRRKRAPMNPNNIKTNAKRGEAPGKAGKVSRMRVSNSEGLASHTGPESWLHPREGFRQALTGECAGWVLSRESFESGVPTLFPCMEGNTPCAAIARRTGTPRGRRPHARTETPCTEPGRSRRWPHPVGAVRAVNKKVQP